MNLNKYKAEIFRRSAEKIKKRKKTRHILALCVPLVLVITALILLPPPKAADMAQQETIAEVMDLDGQTSGSAQRSYVKAKLTIDGKTVTVTDKIKVDKLYNITGFDHEISYGCAPAKPESEQEVMEDREPTFGRAEKTRTIIFYTADGASHLYWFDEDQLERILEVLK